MIRQSRHALRRVIRCGTPATTTTTALSSASSPSVSAMVAWNWSGALDGSFASLRNPTLVFERGFQSKGFDAAGPTRTKSGGGEKGTMAGSNAPADEMDAKDKNILDNLLKSHDVVALAEVIEDAGRERDTMSVAELHELVRTFKTPARSEAETQKMMKLLEDSGRVIVLEDMVYLHPRDVTASVLRVLPGVPSRVYGVTDTDLKSMQTEFETLNESYQQAQRSAAARSRMVVSSGLLVLCLQLATFVRLTYVEFSWDVMEPLSYFVGLANAIAVYIYYLWNRRDFSFETWQSSLESKSLKRTLQSKGVDLDRYVSLARRLRRQGR